MNIRNIYGNGIVISRRERNISSGLMRNSHKQCTTHLLEIRSAGSKCADKKRRKSVHFWNELYRCDVIYIMGKHIDSPRRPSVYQIHVLRSYLSQLSLKIAAASRFFHICQMRSNRRAAWREMAFLRHGTCVKSVVGERQLRGSEGGKKYSCLKRVR
jgi:hypothetical protein